MRVRELPEVLSSEPEGAPQKIAGVVVEPVTVEIDRRIERQRTSSQDVGVRHHQRDRPLVLNTVLHQTDIRESALVLRGSDDATGVTVLVRDVTSDQTSVAYRVAREALNHTPLFHVPHLIFVVLIVPRSESDISQRVAAGPTNRTPSCQMSKIFEKTF